MPDKALSGGKDEDLCGFPALEDPCASNGVSSQN
jgi:hypothetical protein